MLMRAATVVQQLCNSCASLAGLVLCFIACFILLVIASLLKPNTHRRRPRDSTRQLRRDGVGGVYWAYA